MRIWITGAAGFLGCRLIAALTTAGHDVIGISRRPLTGVGTSVVLDVAAEHAGDQLAALANERGRPDAVVHAASRQPGPFPLADFARSNVVATANVLDALPALQPRQVLYTSTLAVYSRPSRNPVDETQPVRGDSPYAVTKLAAEGLVLARAGEWSVLVLRLPSLYGRGQADSFVDGLARSAVSGEPIELFSRGEIVRDALHVSEVVSAIRLALERPPREPRLVLNLGCGARVTAREYAETLVRCLGSPSRIELVDRAGPHADLYADVGAAQRSLGFEPLPLHAALERYADELRC
jgi:nucleoside-diphosphate-sugar epimerase